MEVSARWVPLVEIWLRVARSHYYYFTNEMLIFLMKKTKRELVLLPVTQRYLWQPIKIHSNAYEIPLPVIASDSMAEPRGSDPLPGVESLTHLYAECFESE